MRPFAVFKGGCFVGSSEACSQYYNIIIWGVLVARKIKKTQQDHLNLKNMSFKGTNCNHCNSLFFLFLIFRHSQSSKYICHLDAADFYMNRIRRHSPRFCICPLLQTHHQLGINAGEITNKRHFRDVSLFSFHRFFICSHHMSLFVLLVSDEEVVNRRGFFFFFFQHGGKSAKDVDGVAKEPGVIFSTSLLCISTD